MRFDETVNKFLEMYLNLDVAGSLYPKDPATNKVIKSDSFPIPEEAQKIDQINGFDLFFASGEDWFEFYVSNQNDTEASVRMAGSILDHHIYQEREIDASKTNKFPVISLYEYLILNKNIKLITDNEHSIGGKSIWIKLMKNPRIKFYHGVEHKSGSKQPLRFSEFIPFSEKQLLDPLEFWDEHSRYSKLSAVVVLAEKK